MIIDTRPRKLIQEISCPVCRSGYVDGYNLPIHGFNNTITGTRCDCGFVAQLPGWTPEQIIRRIPSAVKVMLRGEFTGLMSYKQGSLQ